MELNKTNNKLILSKDDVENLCRKCGSCCRELDIQDRIVISFQLKEIIISKVCPYTTKDGCSIREREPKHCKQWLCGVVENLKSFFTSKT
jgi:hypothetical protein